MNTCAGAVGSIRRSRVIIEPSLQAVYLKEKEDNKSLVIKSNHVKYVQQVFLSIVHHAFDLFLWIQKIGPKNLTGMIVKNLYAWTRPNHCIIFHI